MSLLALGVTLLAAVLHALWNQLLAGSGSAHARTAVGMLVGSVVFLPLALHNPRVEPRAWGFIAASVVVELAYFATLAAAYERAPMGVVYPVARGSAPVLVLVVSTLALGVRVTVASAVGIVLVVAGILLVRGFTGTVRLRHLALALLIGAFIAGYTLIDAAGLRYASPAAYLEIVFVAVAVAYSAGLAVRTGFGSLREVLDWRTAVAGIGMFAAYGLVLLALTLAPAPPVAAARETSVVIAMVLLAATRQERVTPLRLVGAVLVCTGIAAIVG